MSIEVNQLTKQYETGQRAVDQISFSLNAGEIVGFLGPNGAGKSTTMKILTGYLPATQGSVMVEGFDVSKSPMDVRQHIGYLPEHNPLYLDLYVKEFLRFSGRLHGLNGSLLTRRVSDMIELVGLTREQSKKIGQLSKGYRQRVGLAQALLHDPAVLILDEPTTGLDPNQLADIRSVIKQAGRNKTVLFSTHIMQEVEALCDRVIIINRGKIVADGALSQLRATAGHKATVVAEFEHDLAHTQELSALPGVEQVDSLGNGHYRITATAETDLRAAIFRLAADRGLTLVGLRQEASSLEGIFRSLTQG
ncbi:gliding motility-associated ABC transporter ATP-binding subunit GldA [Arsenicibacter rosenii]|uniref:Gliding motility-associated ABC transporter ATP-binding subunit GldA n=1 Tax=Arsenicibacter rosenii TaxID=1750698 RepID=A0A1S2VI01_9BACT|nr:gliding motility-associated ABC transporter ATP-binding subunit GldA [Arsenicibacter rosenii]OIN58387.1 gliding motility-associated ABC transporter ATP-binding subunit GldA [Arsenicibacter rosenii]